MSVSPILPEAGSSLGGAGQREAEEESGPGVAEHQRPPPLDFSTILGTQFVPPAASSYDSQDPHSATTATTDDDGLYQSPVFPSPFMPRRTGFQSHPSLAHARSQSDSTGLMPRLHGHQPPPHHVYHAPSSSADQLQFAQGQGGAQRFAPPEAHSTPSTPYFGSGPNPGAPIGDCEEPGPGQNHDRSANDGGAAAAGQGQESPWSGQISRRSSTGVGPI
jgi:hypothetical protein